MFIKGNQAMENTLNIFNTFKKSSKEEEVNKNLNFGRSNEQYTEKINSHFLKNQRKHTTILASGLTIAHDLFFTSTLEGLNYKVKALDCPDNEALQLGKEFGNRGQCNPTYFTVGNLIKYLIFLRDQKGMSKDAIIKNYVFVTAGACGPCRFGMYVTEYRKALRDSGFSGFRVILLSQTAGINQEVGEGYGLEVNGKFFFNVIRSLVLGDILNALMYRIRPYEKKQGETNKKIEQCKAIIMEALKKNKSIIMAALKCRKILSRILVDRSIIKPKVSIIGEFWAMTTEGDGNYKMQSFLESEGAEVDIQLLTSWLFYTIWELRHDTIKRRSLKKDDQGERGLYGVKVQKKLFLLFLAKKSLLFLFKFYAFLFGLKKYHFVDMDHLAQIGNKYYDNELRGGEGHMEVAKLIENVAKKKTTMTLSIKPFGCMPSSSVSDGIQSLIMEHFPDANYLPVETTGDGAVNVYGRVQMQLFKAKQSACDEVERILSDKMISMESFKKEANKKKYSKALYQASHFGTTSSSDFAAELI